MHELHVEPDDYDNDPDEDEHEEALLNCGLDEEGFCSLAGTEHCDFECPFRGEMK